MVEKRILIIDDQSQDLLCEEIKRILRKDKIDFYSEWINPLSTCDVDVDGVSCLESVKNELNSRLQSTYYSLAAIDYSYSDDLGFNGWDIIKHIRSKDSKLPIILYTGEQSRVVRDILASCGMSDLNQQVDEIVHLMKSNISEFLSRDNGLRNKIIELLKRRDFESLLLSKLKQHGELIVKAPQLGIHEKQLNEIASILQKEGANGRYPEDTWLNEIFDQLIAYLTKIYE